MATLSLRQAIGKGPVQVLTVLGVFAVGAMVVPDFAAPSSVRAMLVIASFLGIAAIGQTFVILIGGIDLSVPALVGAGNGLVTGVWRLPPLVVTLATGSVVGGAVLLWTNATLTGSAPAWLTEFTSPASATGPVPVAPVVVTWVVLALLARLFILRTRPGRAIHMLGANRDAARLMLVDERRTTVLCFAVSGGLAGLSGVLLTGFTGAGLFTVGDPYLFQTIAAVVIGGTSLLGGRGGIGRSVLGSLTLVALTTLLIGLALTAAAQQAVLGAVIVLVTACYGRDRAVGERI